jgi:hypothetical protein
MDRRSATSRKRRAPTDKYQENSVRHDESEIDWRNPYRESAGSWLKGDLHVHTVLSRDGEISEDVLLPHFEQMDYRFVAITDHNVVSSGVHPRSRLAVFEGLEADFNYRFHTNVIHFDRERIRYDSNWDHRTLVEENADSGCLVILNHPNWGPSAHYTVDYLRRANSYDGIEIYNVGTEDDPGSPLATDVWDRLLSSGKRVLGFANQDVHKLRHLKNCGNIVRATSGEREEIFSALKRGNFYCYYGVEIVEIGRERRTIRVDTKNADSIRFIGRNGRVITEVHDKGAELEFQDVELYSYIRVECLGRDGRRSWTQPFFRG